MFLTHIKAGVDNVERRFLSHHRITRYIVAHTFPLRRLPEDHLLRARSVPRFPHLYCHKRRAHVSQEKMV